MKRFTVAATAGLLIAGSGFVAIRAQEDGSRRHRAPSDGGEQAITQQELPVSDPTCTFFGPQHDKFVEALRPSRHSASRMTEDVVAKLTIPESNASASLPTAPGGSRTDAAQNPVGIIDKYIFQQLSDSNVAPAPPTTDQEFLRRVTLDLTGRIPTPQALIAFLNDASPDKRSKLVDSLIGTPEWVDKWTIFLADLYKNSSTNDLGANRYAQGVSAFNSYIRTALQNETPYNKVVNQLIATVGTNSWDQGDMNFLVGGVMGGGPIQDVFDQQTAIVAEKFLGMAHVNCILCHNGRGHLDAISLWGYYKTRNDAWGMASFLSRTNTARVTPTGSNQYYWSIQNTRAVDYQLNTQTGNRPARGATNSKQTVSPVYIMNGAAPPAGSNYRQFLADQVTGDFQFARATVNYMWEYFFGIGLVTPSNQFDPMRLDPDNPPTDCPLPTSPCTLQASHPRLLNELAQSFVNSGYNVKALMRQMVNSRAYQLSSRYDGTWNSANERLFGRKLVRRLWSEEIVDGITQSSVMPVTFSGTNWNPASVNWAMQLPEPLNTGNGAATVLNAFLRGNRDDEVRRGDSTIPQALALMNDSFVMNRVVVNATNNPNALIVKMLATPAGQEDQAVAQMYLTVLSRYPTSQELSTAVANIKGASNATAKTLEYRTLLWSLYNKVDFMFNY